LKTSNLILDFEFDQHLGSHKHVINIIMWFRDMECYNDQLLLVPHGDTTGHPVHHVLVYMLSGFPTHFTSSRSSVSLQASQTNS
jgi:hypothetical protein